MTTIHNHEPFPSVASATVGMGDADGMGVGDTDADQLMRHVGIVPNAREQASPSTETLQQDHQS